MEQTSDGLLRFSCGHAHQLAVKRLFLEACKLPPEQPIEPRPLHIFDKKVNSTIAVASLGQGLYEARATEPVRGVERRVATIARGLIRLGEMEESRRSTQPSPLRLRPLPRRPNRPLTRPRPQRARRRARGRRHGQPRRTFSPQLPRIKESIMPASMTSRERVLAALARQPVDRTPLCNPTSVATVELMDLVDAPFPAANREPEAHGTAGRHRLHRTGL